MSDEITIEYKEINKLIPYDNNPRLNDSAVEAVAASIKRFGFRQPIVVAGDGTIVAGHTRYKAALKLGLETVPCVSADDLTSDEINAYRLVDNKTSELSGWDYNLLSGELLAIPDIDMTEFGFTLDEIQIPDVNVDSLFVDGRESKKKSKTIVCPHCGKEFQL